MADLAGARILVVGAGLSGLTAAADLSARGARVEVVEARPRLGGRTWTVRDALTGVHTEAGGEFVDGGHAALRALCRALGLTLTPVLRDGFGQALDFGGRKHVRRSSGATWRAFAHDLRAAIAAYRRDGDDTGVAAGLVARRSFLDAIAATPERRAMAESMRGFYLADPEALSALVVVEQFAWDDDVAPGMARICGGTERLVTGLAARVQGRITTGRVVRAIRQTATGVRVTVEDVRGRRVDRRADYVVMTAPAPLVLDCQFDPPLPATQHAALTGLRMGSATKLSLRFDHPWWRAPRRPRAFGTNLPIGAVWEGAEDQRDAAVLVCLAGGSSSAALRTIIRRDGPDGVTRHLTWLGAPSAAAMVGGPVTWEDDPWARGGYAVVPPGFDPRLHAWLRARHGRILFAGEHTSRRWQGYMNGAVESGQRAAAEVVALHGLVSAGWAP